MTKQLLSAIAALGLVVSVSANAAMKSEFFYQTDADKNQLTPELVYSNQNFKFDVTGDPKRDIKETTLNLRYERGINEMLSAGAMVPYSTTTQETKSTNTDTLDQKGLGNLTLFLKGNHSIAEGSTVWFGGDLVLSPGDQTAKEKDAGADTKYEVNGYAGGHSLNPYVGYSMLMGSYVIGTKLSTELGIGDRTVKTTNLAGTESKTKVTGGNTTALTVFGEMPITAGNVGAKLTYAGVSTSKSKDAAGTTTPTGGYTTIGLGFYGNYDVSETAAVIAGFDYTKLASDTAFDTKVKSTSAMALNVGGRFTF